MAEESPPAPTTEFQGLPVAEDVIFAGVVEGLPEQAGKCVAITGCTTGTGFYAAKAAVQKGVACVLLLNRTSERADAAEAQLQAAAAAAEQTRIVTVECDLQSFASVRAAAAKVNAIAAEFGGLDVLVNNAGIMGVPDERTPDGYDVQMQTNHLSHFLLTNLTMPSLEAAAASRGEARVVQHSSGARGSKRADDKVGHLRPEFFTVCEANELGGHSPPACFNRYHQTKLSNTVFAMALHDKLSAAGSKVKSTVAEPGVATTALATNLCAGHQNAGLDASWMNQMLKHYPKMQSSADGACPLLMCAFASGVSSGDFYAPKDKQQGATMGMPVKVLEGGVLAGSCPEWTKEAHNCEGLTLAKPNHELLWTASEAAVGAWGAVSAEEGVPRKYKMTYFDIQGPAEPGRLALTIGGIPFEDERVNREQMTAMKEAGELPCGQVPVLEVDGMKLSQSQAIATYCGKLTGLYPADPWAAAKCDEVTQLVNQDIRERCISPTMRESDAGKKAELRKELAEIKLPAKFTILEALLSPSGYFVGDSITMADLHVYVLLNWLGMEVLDGVPKEVVLAFPGLTRLVQTLNEHPTIKAWNAGKNSKLPWLE